MSTLTHNISSHERVPPPFLTKISSVYISIRKMTNHFSEEILDVECLEYPSPSWTRSIWTTDQAVKWAKAKVCVYADSVLCVGQ